MPGGYGFILKSGELGQVQGMTRQDRLNRQIRYAMMPSMSCNQSQLLCFLLLRSRDRKLVCQTTQIVVRDNLLSFSEIDKSLIEQITLIVGKNVAELRHATDEAMTP